MYICICTANNLQKTEKRIRATIKTTKLRKASQLQLSFAVQQHFCAKQQLWYHNPHHISPIQKQKTPKTKEKTLSKNKKDLKTWKKLQQRNWFYFLITLEWMQSACQLSKPTNSQVHCLPDWLNKLVVGRPAHWHIGRLARLRLRLNCRLWRWCWQYALVRWRLDHSTATKHCANILLLIFELTSLN